MSQETQAIDGQRPWTAEEAANFLRIHPRTITRMARAGQIPGFRIGTHWRFLRSDMDSWMRSQVSFPSKLNIPVRGN
jgi:excisionase family DNA binding protein